MSQTNERKSGALSPAELMDLLSKTIPAKLPVLIKGAPGIGKSDIVAQAAERAEANLVLMHPVVSDPTDFKGMPAVISNGTKEAKADFIPFGDLDRLMKAKVPTLAFLDDLGQAPPVVQAACMQLILARQVNGHAISEHVVFAAATNRKEDRAAVTGILEPVKSRFATIVELAPTLDDWCKWAVAHDVAPELIAFLRFRPDLFTSGKPTNDISNTVSPRTITNLGKLYQAGVRNNDALAGACGSGFATEFTGFVRVFSSLPSIDAILISPGKAPVPEEPAALYAVATALGSRIDKTNVGRVLTYAERLPEEFMVLCVRDGLNKTPTAQESKDFIKWAAVNQDLIS